MKADMERTLARVAEVGYREVEFAGYFGQDPKEIRAMLGRCGLAAPAAHVDERLLVGDWAKIFADAMQGWYDQLIANIKSGDTRTFNEKLWEPSTWPRQARGAGFMEAPRGALGHWIVIEDGKIANYQAVVPSTWNAGPRDPQGQPGAYEAALVGHQLHDPKQPIEILRTIHSFDPCIACAVHVSGPNGSGESLQVAVNRTAAD